jgi:hypothetical protein
MHADDGPNIVESFGRLDGRTAGLES